MEGEVSRREGVGGGGLHEGGWRDLQEGVSMRDGGGISRTVCLVEGVSIREGGGALQEGV